MKEKIEALFNAVCNDINVNYVNWEYEWQRTGPMWNKAHPKTRVAFSYCTVNLHAEIDRGWINKVELSPTQTRTIYALLEKRRDEAYESKRLGEIKQTFSDWGIL